MNTQEKVTDALKQGMEDGYKASKAKNLTWWERTLWVILAGIAAAASTYFTGCAASYSQSAEGGIHSAVVILPVEMGK